MAETRKSYHQLWLVCDRCGGTWTSGQEPTITGAYDLARLAGWRKIGREDLCLDCIYDLTHELLTTDEDVRAKFRMLRLEERHPSQDEEE